jgi:beta-glucanase (GH16 family)
MVAAVVAAADDAALHHPAARHSRSPRHNAVVLIPNEWTWTDDFQGPAGHSPDSDTWDWELGAGGWGGEQLQDYTSSTSNASLTGDGQLAITAQREADGRITSARLITKGRVTARYGRVEARIKVPAERGAWPAFWMLGEDIDEVGWPACGEIDVMEYVAVDPTRVHGTLHAPGYSGLDGGAGRAHDLKQPLADDFHRYAVLWSPEHIEWLLDDKPYHRLTPTEVPGPWPFDHDFYLLLNLAIGGAWPGNSGFDPTLPTTMLVDWVRITTPRSGV